MEMVSGIGFQTLEWFYFGDGWFVQAHSRKNDGISIDIKANLSLRLQVPHIRSDGACGACMVGH